MKKPIIFTLFVSVFLVLGSITIYLLRPQSISESSSTNNQYLETPETPIQTSQQPLGTRLAEPIDVSYVEMQNAQGSLITPAEFSGNINLLFFGYVSCPDLCPLVMQDLGQMMETLDDPEKVKVYMMSVDPEDSAELVQRYASAFNPSFTGLAGNNEQIANALEAFFMAASQVATKRYSHTTAIMVLDDKGQTRYLYAGETMDALGQDLNLFLTKGF